MEGNLTVFERWNLICVHCTLTHQPILLSNRSISFYGVTSVSAHPLFLSLSLHSSERACNLYPISLNVCFDMVKRRWKTANKQQSKPQGGSFVCMYASFLGLLLFCFVFFLIYNMNSPNHLIQMQNFELN